MCQHQPQPQQKPASSSSAAAAKVSTKFSVTFSEEHNKVHVVERWAPELLPDMFYQDDDYHRFQMDEMVRWRRAMMKKIQSKRRTTTTTTAPIMTQPLPHDLMAQAVTPPPPSGVCQTRAMTPNVSVFQKNMPAKRPLPSSSSSSEETNQLRSAPVA